MNNLNSTQFRILVQKYLNGTATTQEKLAVEEYYSLFEVETDILEEVNKDVQDKLEIKMQKNIFNRIEPLNSTVQTRRIYQWIMLAATIAAVGFFLLFQRKTHLQQANDISIIKDVKKEAPFNQFLQLPDGTTVVLHGNSRLEYDSNFNTHTRAVTLIGEAYFDVKHNALLPFVIHTGKIKTTVLGTAFNIKAWPEQKDIIVSVARGKVKVEDHDKFVAILTPDKQVVYNTESQIADLYKIHADSSTTWVQSDMTFDNMPFGSLADHLSRRYNLKIVFQNDALKNCPFTGRFSGTESVHEILDILSTTSNTTYRLNGREVIISGEKCL